MCARARVVEFEVDSSMKTPKGFQFNFKGSLLENKEKPVFQMKFKGNLLENSLLLREGHTFVSFRKMSAHIMEGNFLYSKSTDINVKPSSLV